MLALAILTPLFAQAGVLGWATGTLMRCARWRRWTTNLFDAIIGAAAFGVGGLLGAVIPYYFCVPIEVCRDVPTVPQPIAVAYAAAVIVPVLRAALESEHRPHFWDDPTWRRRSG